LEVKNENQEENTSTVKKTKKKWGKKEYFAISIYLIILLVYILCFNLPDGSSNLERILSSQGISSYVKMGTKQLYMPGWILLFSTLIAFGSLKIIFRKQLTLWKNGLLLWILVIALLWQLIF